jgi:GTP-binding protein Era
VQIYLLFKSGFISIVGCPNAGKSTLLNLLIGNKLSIISPKVQTTRHRIMGIYNIPDAQLIFLDTPGIIKPKYKLQEHMMQFVDDAIADADVIVLVTGAQPELIPDTDFLNRLHALQRPLIVVINKIDTLTETVLAECVLQWKNRMPNARYVPISALHRFNHPMLIEAIVAKLPEHPPYYDADMLTDRTERFIAAEYIREEVFSMFHQEVPYSCDIQITAFKTDSKGIHIQGIVLVERESQKGILIGQGGKALKQLGIRARKKLEPFFEKPIHLMLHVKVESDWRNQNQKLKQLGY